MQIKRSTTLPGDPCSVRDALLRPELLSAWLGPWSEQHDGRAIVTTDDGVERAVSGHRVDDDGSIRWSWSPVDRPDERSEVVIRLDDLGDAGTNLVLHETRIDGPSPTSASASAAATGAQDSAGSRWTRCLLALGAVMEQRRAVTV